MVNKNRQIILSLDSSTVKASVAVAEINENANIILSELTIVRQRSHSEQMNLAIEKVLQAAKIDFSSVSAVAVTEGPGSFTGLRVAGNIAKTTAYLLKVPIVSVNTLDALSLQAQPNIKSKYICSMVNAFKQMVFMSLYEKGANGLPVQILSPSLYSLDQVAPLLPDMVQCIGDAYEYYSGELSDTLREKLLRSEDPNDYPLAKSIIEIAARKLKVNSTLVWNQFLPLYLKASEAEENLRKGLLHFRKLE